MADPQRLLLKTTIATTEDDWHIGRFSMLSQHLAGLRRASGQPLYAVTAADRRDAGSGDADIVAAGDGAFDQVWLFAVDLGSGLSDRDAEQLARFHARGGGLMLTRDHQDLGRSLAKLGAIGATQCFQSVNPEAEEARRVCDDVETPAITWPNYHSGANGDLQAVEAVEPLHPVLAGNGRAPLRRLPAHPHEGAVAAPPSLGVAARVVARGRSATTGRLFDLCVTIEELGAGRVVADSSFHHFCDYNWDPRKGCPSFVTEPPGDQVLREPEALADTHRYVQNIAAWLAGSV